ncbi:MerR family transcriptional regulator [Exilibacterium tricleocarpae]|uniref:MerR family transcriptional regulator n=1 Tax=Exilibacterium tricleocarpae TaxID=2591008 RepID=A0A545T8J6_9GAMM|nr:MerR family transcriptional regulator [Exilibacterium tricleocarpae]TQV73531.1 MerR family transcriptional regulator [Exilibacterium tricleocarpae]
MTISELAKRSGLSTHTLRYYERIGLLPDVRRGSNGHRVFAERDLEWLAFIKKLKATGMPIAQIQHYVALVKQGDATLAERQTILENHRVYVREQLGQWQNWLAAIDYKIDYYQKHRLQVVKKA